MICSLYPSVFLFITNMIIANILFSYNLCNFSTLEVPIIGPPTTYNKCHDTTKPIFYVRVRLCHGCKQVENVGHECHQYSLSRIWLSYKH